MNTISEILRRQAAAFPDGIALLATDGRQPLTFARLAEESRRIAGQLRTAGVERDTCVAITLPNGPELAVSLLAAFLAGRCAPLNPAYSDREFEFYLGDLNARVLLVPAGADIAARKAAQRLGIRVIEIAALRNKEAGVFEFTETLPCGEAGEPAPEDVALVLHTSGTTARPKLVPLTHRNICQSAANIRSWFDLTRADRCLQVMPLFHVHGMIGALLSSISAGASVVATPGFDAERFGKWVDELQPTWYTAVPTIHQSILTRANLPRQHSFRFIRSCSSPLPPAVMAELEARFGVPVVESYGMTEGAHQIASNPLPPTPRKPASVGKAVGTKIAILNDAGDALRPGEQGEVVIKGPNITSGYAANPEANQAAFRDGWFRTGDRGYLDEDGYLFLAGRMKELINRGGEKIAPREIDEALLEHPAVAEAVAFAIPDAVLGEDVGAAIVLKPGAGITDRELREHAAARLSYYKIPRRFVLVEQIPKGPTGKPQRIGLAAKLDLSSAALPAESPQGPAENLLAGIWRSVLKAPSVGRHDNFFDLGGDSLQAAQVIARVREASGSEVRMSDIFALPTIAELSCKIQTDAKPAPSSGPVRKDRSGPIRPLSQAQEGMWFMAQISDRQEEGIRPFLFRVSGSLDVTALELAFRHVVERHEALRTRIAEEDGVPQGVLADPATFCLQRLQPCGMQSAEQVATAFLRRPFDLGRDLPMRAAVIDAGTSQWRLAISMHHSCSDGFSDAIFMRELSAAYRAFRGGRPPELPPVPFQYADFAEWQRTRLQDPELQEQLAYWRRRLQAAPAEVRLPFDRPRNTLKEQGDTCECVLEQDIWGAVKAAARRSNATAYVVLLAGVFQLLHEAGGDEDIVVGSPVANRPNAETEQLIGLFMNTVVLRCSLAGAHEAGEILRRVREAAMGAIENQDLPIEQLAKALPRPRGRSFEPRYKVGFQLRNVPQRLPEFDGAAVEAMPFHMQPSFLDLSFLAVEQGTTVRVHLTYNAGVFERSTAERLLSSYAAVLGRLTREPVRTSAGVNA
jgi:acyl-CoA synthetase (AMP-forming)/AMP-acid ligase II